MIYNFFEIDDIHATGVISYNGSTFVKLAPPTNIYLRLLLFCLIPASLDPVVLCNAECSHSASKDLKTCLSGIECENIDSTRKNIDFYIEQFVCIWYNKLSTIYGRFGCVCRFEYKQ